MKWIFFAGLFIVLLLLAFSLVLRPPGEDAAQSTIPTEPPTQIEGDDWNNDGVVDERDAALYH